MKIDGDKATVQIPENAGTHTLAGTVKLEKQGGSWKIDAASLYSLEAKTPAQITAQQTLVQKVADIATQTAGKVRDHKYSSVKDAYIDFETQAAGGVPAPATATAPAGG